MGYLKDDDDEPLTPVGWIFTRREFYQVMNWAVTTDGPIDVRALQAELANSAFVRLPRFTSLFLRHPRTGREFWRKTALVLDQHIKVIDDGKWENINDYLADLAVSCPLPTDKPLWEVHVLKAHNCTVFRVHHSLADGISFMSLLQSFFGGTTSSKPTTANRRKSEKKSLYELIRMAWFSVVYVVEFIFRCLWVRDGDSAVSGGDGVQLWPRKIATASFSLEDVNIVRKSVFPNADISDLMEDTRSGWGNKISFIFHPEQLQKPDEESDPLHLLKSAKASMDRKKLSKVARLSHIFGNLAKTLLGPNIMTWLNYRMTLSTTFTFSNIVGPSQEVTMVGKRVTSLKLSASSLPHAITIHMLSYAGKAEMQIQVAKDIIPDPDVLAKCFEDALQRLKKAAVASSYAHARHLF